MLKTRFCEHFGIDAPIERRRSARLRQNRARTVPLIKYPTPRGTPLVAGSGVAI
jgi:hypothetical protein